MASTTFTNNNNDDSDDFLIRRTWSSDEEETMMAGANRFSNRQEMKEILVKWQVPGNLAQPDAKKNLNRILVELLMSYPEELTLVDHKQREWSHNNKDTEDVFTKECEEISVQLHPVRNNQQKVIKWVAITKMYTKRAMTDWKNNDHFYSQMIEAKIYMFPHPFRAEEWDISSIGFIKDIHVAHHTQEYIQETILNIIKKQEKQPPTFQLIPQRITNKDKSATTRAYTVQCAKADAKQLIHLLTHGEFRSHPIFIPFRYKTSQPDIFTKCIRQQNDIYHRIWVIKLEGITPEIMTYLRNDIEKFNGVSQVVPTRRIGDKGEWKILVDQAKCAFVHKQLSAMWQTLMTYIPTQAIEKAPATFRAPQISSQKVRAYQDNTSDTDSYGSLLTTGTDTSERFDDEQLNDLPTQYTYPSYASAAATSTSSHDSPQLSSPTQSTFTDWQKEKQELEQMIRHQADQIEKIQADLEARVTRSHDLEEQLAQAIELAHSRDARHEEMLQKFELLLNKYGESPTGTPNLQYPPAPHQRMESLANIHKITPPPTRSMTTHSPPPKKPNNSTTPTRPVYPVFRKPDSANQNTQTSNLKRPPPLLTQPMDTPAETTEPTPGVRAGPTQE